MRFLLSSFITLGKFSLTGLHFQMCYMHSDMCVRVEFGIRRCRGISVYSVYVCVCECVTLCKLACLLFGNQMSTIQLLTLRGISLSLSLSMLDTHASCTRELYHNTSNIINIMYTV